MSPIQLVITSFLLACGLSVMKWRIRRLDADAAILDTPPSWWKAELIKAMARRDVKKLETK